MTRPRSPASYAVLVKAKFYCTWQNVCPSLYADELDKRFDKAKPKGLMYNLKKIVLFELIFMYFCQIGFFLNCSPIFNQGADDSFLMYNCL